VKSAVPSTLPVRRARPKIDS